MKCQGQQGKELCDCMLLFSFIFFYILSLVLLTHCPQVAVLFSESVFFNLKNNSLISSNFYYISKYYYCLSYLPVIFSFLLLSVITFWLFYIEKGLKIWTVHLMVILLMSQAKYFPTFNGQYFLFQIDPNINLTSCPFGLSLCLLSF